MSGVQPPRHVWLVALVVLLAIGGIVMVRPFWSDLYMGRQELALHAYLAADAKREILAGQWLLSFLNDATVGFQPWYRDYSVLPYVLTVPIQIIFGFTGYKAILVLDVVLFVVAGTGMFAVCRYFRAHPVLALAAGAAYGLSPYAMDDVLLRGVLPEWTVVALLPITFYCFLRCYATQGRRYTWPTVALVAALLLTHKILLPWFYCAFGLYAVLITVGPNPRQPRRWSRLVRRTARLALPVLAGFLLTAPYWLEAYVSAPKMLIGAELHTYYEGATSGWQILIPIWRAGIGVEGAGLALKLGAPTTLGILLALICGVRRCTAWAAGAIALLLGIFVAGGSGLWSHVPSPFVAVQFPYRLLSLANLFGIVGLALGGNRLRRLLARLAFSTPVLGAALLLLALGTTIEFYRGDHGPGMMDDPAATLEAPALDVRLLPGDYIETPQPIHASVASGYDEQFEDERAAAKTAFYELSEPPDSGKIVLPGSAMVFHGYTGIAQATVDQRALVILPAAFSSFLHVEVHDDATGQTQQVAATNEAGRIAVWLDPGTYTVQATRDFFGPALGAFWAGVLLVGALLVHQKELLRRPRRRG